MVLTREGPAEQCSTGPSTSDPGRPEHATARDASPTSVYCHGETTASSVLVELILGGATIRAPERRSRGNGDGHGCGYGNGDGTGYGSGVGDGYGGGQRRGDGSGDGSGYGIGSGRGDGSGCGYAPTSATTHETIRWS